MLIDDVGHAHVRNYDLGIEHQPQMRRRKRRRSFWIPQQRRSAIEFEQTHPQLEFDQSIVHSEQDVGDNRRQQELISAIRRLQLWEAALLRRFGDRILNQPERHAAHVHLTFTCTLKNDSVFFTFFFKLTDVSVKYPCEL